MESIELKISLLQPELTFKDINSASQALQNLAAKALSRKKRPNILVVPRLFLPEETNTGNDPSTELLKNIAARCRITIVSYDIFGRVYAIDPYGNIAASCEKTCKTADENAIFNVDGVCCAIAPIHSLRFPETVKQASTLGAKALFVLGTWPKPKEIYWKLLNIVRAIENHFFIIALNQNSFITVDPWGRIIAENKGSDIFTIVIDVNLQDEASKLADYDS